jgi:hypothetical protein
MYTGLCSSCAPITIFFLPNSSLFFGWSWYYINFFAAIDVRTRTWSPPSLCIKFIFINEISSYLKNKLVKNDSRLWLPPLHR